MHQFTSLFITQRTTKLRYNLPDVVCADGAVQQQRSILNS